MADACLVSCNYYSADNGTCLCVCVCVFVYVKFKSCHIRGMIWTSYDWLNCFQVQFLTLGVDIKDRHGPSDEMCRQLQLKVTKASYALCITSKSEHGPLPSM